MGIYGYIYIYITPVHDAEIQKIHRSTGRGALSTPYVWPCWTSILDLTSGAEPCHGLPWASLHWRPKILVRCIGLVGGFKHFYFYIPSGKRLHNYGKSPFFMGKSTFNRKLLVYQRIMATVHANSSWVSDLVGIWTASNSSEFHR